jgi:hypothetical protein
MRQSKDQDVRNRANISEIGDCDDILGKKISWQILHIFMILIDNIGQEVAAYSFIFCPHLHLEVQEGDEYAIKATRREREIPKDGQ